MFGNLIKPNYSSFEVRDNFQRVALIWESEIQNEEMPILRSNWLELQVDYQVYLTESEMLQNKERVKKWANAYTNL